MNLPLDAFTARLTFLHPVSKTFRYATAMLITDNIAVTPAHNLYDRQANAPYTNFEFQMGEEVCKVTAHCFMKQYCTVASQKQCKLYDYAVLQLETPICKTQSICGFLLEKDKKYAQLRTVLVDKDKIISQLKDQMQKVRSELEISTKTIDTLKQQANSLTNQIMSLTHTNATLLEQIQCLKSHIDFPQPNMPHLDLSLSAIHQNINQSQLTHQDQPSSIFYPSEASYKWDLSHPTQNNYYSISQHNIRCKQTNFMSLRITAAYPLPQKSRTLFRVISYADENSYISFGVVSGGERTGLHSRDTVEYFLCNKSATCSIKIDGEDKVKKESCFYLKRNQAVTMDVDRTQLHAKFKKGKSTLTLPLKPSLKEKELFLFLMIWNKGDEVELLPL